MPVSVKMGLLALLAQAPKYGAQLKSEFENHTGGTLPLNIGQVYTTLARLERDGLVLSCGEPDAEGRIAYQLTDAGRREVDTWWATPVQRVNAARDELVIKLALALADPTLPVEHLLQTQRSASMAHLQNLHALARQLHTQRPSPDQAPRQQGLLLVIEHMIFMAEAEAKWLEQLHTHLGAKSPPRPSTNP